MFKVLQYLTFGFEQYSSMSLLRSVWMFHLANSHNFTSVTLLARATFISCKGVRVLCGFERDGERVKKSNSFYDFETVSLLDYPFSNQAAFFY